MTDQDIDTKKNKRIIKWKGLVADKTLTSFFGGTQRGGDHYVIRHVGLLVAAENYDDGYESVQQTEG